MLPHGLRHSDTADRSNAFEAGRDIHAVAKDVPTFDNYVPDVYSHAEFDALLLWHSKIPRSHSALNIGGAGDSAHDAWEFDQQTVPGQLNNASLVLRDLAVNQFRAQLFKCSQCGGLVLAHEPAVSDYVGGKNST